MSDVYVTLIEFFFYVTVMGLVLDTGFDHFQRDLYININCFWSIHLYRGGAIHNCHNTHHKLLHKCWQGEEQPPYTESWLSKSALIGQRAHAWASIAPAPLSTMNIGTHYANMWHSVMSQGHGNKGGTIDEVFQALQEQCSSVREERSSRQRELDSLRAFNTHKNVYHTLRGRKANRKKHNGFALKGSTTCCPHILWYNAKRMRLLLHVPDKGWRPQ